MHILFFAENSPYLAIRVGGAENSMRLMAEGLAAKGHHVTFASLRPDVLPWTRAFRAERGRGGAPARHPPLARPARAPPPRARRGGRRRGCARPAGAGSGGRSSRGAGQDRHPLRLLRALLPAPGARARADGPQTARDAHRHAHGRPRLAGGGAARRRRRRARRGGRALQRGRRRQLPLAARARRWSRRGRRSSGFRWRRGRASSPTSASTWAGCRSSGPGRGRARASRSWWRPASPPTRSARTCWSRRSGC